jgi:integrase/recombinase XerD
MGARRAIGNRGQVLPMLASFPSLRHPAETVCSIYLYHAAPAHLQLTSVAMKLAIAVEPYLIYCQAEKMNSPSTLEKYRECFRSWITPCLGASDIETFNRVDVMGFRKAMVDKNLSLSRQYSLVMCLKGLLRFCIEVLKVRTLDPTEIKLPNRGKPNVLTLTHEEINKFLGEINLTTYSGKRLRALIELLLATGMRISEALSLDRITFDSGVDEVEVIGKGEKKRTIFLNGRCHFWVCQYLKARHDDHPAVFVTTGLHPERMVRADISRFFVNLREKAAIPKKITPHTLRHTYCTNLLNNGADITFIKELAGHQDIQTTAKYYLGVDKEQLRKVVDKYLNYGLDQSHI